MIRTKSFFQFLRIGSIKYFFNFLLFMAKVIGRGAEAIIYLDDGWVTKERIKKGYRHPDIDLRRRRLCSRKENKLLVSAYTIINVPKVLDFSDSKMTIRMEFIDGDTLRDVLDSMGKPKRILVCKDLGKNIALLHNSGIIHGDLTTSNFILKGNKLFFIDFGLGFFSLKVEDKAVDLHLLRQAFESKHYSHFEECFKVVLQGYKSACLNSAEVLARLDVVEKRGRYKRRGA